MSDVAKQSQRRSETPILGGNEKYLIAYIGNLADAMGLSEWRITISDDPADEETDAQIAPTYGQQSAVLSIGADWANHSPDKLRYIIVHELVHLFVDQMDIVTRTLENGLGFIGWNIFSQNYRDAEERAVDAIAWSWARTLPLPVKEKAA